MDERQDKAFREAVERKKAEAKERSRAVADTAGPPRGAHPLPDQQQSLVDDGTPPDTFSVRDKNQGKGGKTADKWNQ